MKNETAVLRRWLKPVIVALVIGTAGGCGEKATDVSNSNSSSSESGTTEVLVKSKSGGPTDRVVELSDGSGGGTLKFTLDRGVSLRMPITVCVGFGSVLTVVGREGDTQIDTRIIENATMRGGEPLELSTVSGYRTTGEEDGKRYEEQWQSRRHQSVVREGVSTRVTGVMYGQRLYATSDTTFGPPQPIDGGRDFGFTIEAQCAQ